ncbi:MAG: PAS domain S-box protein [Desulfobacteraceae bacterium]
MNPEGRSDRSANSNDFCPVTGLSVFQKEGWVDVGFGKNFRVTLRVMGGRILHSRPSGEVDLESLEQVLEFTQEVSREVFGEDQGYVQIEDYEGLRWASLEARNAFIKGMKDRPRLAGIVFCNVSPLFKMSIKLARLLTEMRLEVHIEEDLSNAAKRALTILSDWRDVSSIYSSGLLALDREEGGHPEWTLDLGEFKVRYELIEDDVVHTISEGLLKEDHIPVLFEHMESVLASMNLRNKPYFGVNRVKEVRVANRRTRRLFMEKSAAMQGVFPARMGIFYGGGLALRAAIRLARPFLPYKAALAEDLPEALDLIAEAKKEDENADSGKALDSYPADLAGADDTLVSVEEVLRFLGAVDWESNGLALTSDEEIKDPSHPLNPLFESISLLKGDLDQVVKAKEAALRALEIERAYLSQLFENSQLAIVRGFSGGVVRRINRQFTSIFGYTPEEALGRKVDDLIVPEGREEEAGFCTQKVEQGDRVAMETLRRHKDGKLIPVEVLAFPIIIDGQPMGAYSMYLDIRERVRAETELRDSEERHRSILENMNEGYYEADLAGNLTFVNPAMTELLGYSKRELIGLNYRSFTPEENKKKVYSAFNRVYRTGRPDKGFEWETIRKDASRIVVDTSISLIRGPGGDPVGFRGLIRDVSERKRAREEREELRAQLQHSQRMEAVGTLAGGIAHNFNNLLMGIQGNASLIGIDLDPGHPHFARVKAIEGLVKSGSDLTRQLLGYASEGKYEANPTDLNVLIRDLAGTFGATRKDIRINTDLSESLSPVLADKGQVGQALLNLLVNAADAMPQGGELYVGTRNVSGRDMKGRPHDGVSGDYVLLVVRDTGVGMDDETRAKIFEPFFTTKGLSKGTGLGLSSVYGIVKAHGGHINVKSKPGCGATFEVYFPAAETAVGEVLDQAPTIEAGTGNVLLVDDEDIILDVGAEMLSRLSYVVWKARGGVEAIRMFEENHGNIDLVVLDMIMPDMGGGDVYDRLKSIDPKVKVLLSSGYSIDGKAAEILRRGCDDFIQKPFDMNELSRKIADLLARP